MQQQCGAIEAGAHGGKMIQVVLRKKRLYASQIVPSVSQ